MMMIFDDAKINLQHDILTDTYYVKHFIAFYAQIRPNYVIFVIIPAIKLISNIILCNSYNMRYMYLWWDILSNIEIVYVYIYLQWI